MDFLPTAVKKRNKHLQHIHGKDIDYNHRFVMFAIVIERVIHEPT